MDHESMCSLGPAENVCAGIDDAVVLYDDETVEDLQRGGLRIIQKIDGFRFGEDAVILAHFVHRLWDVSRRGPFSFVELGSHCGVVSILLAHLAEGSAGFGLEIMPRQVEVMERNIRLNQMDSRLRSVCCDIRHLAGGASGWPDLLVPGSFDFVVANPPYGLPPGSFEPHSMSAGEAERLIARCEIMLSFKELTAAASRLLRPKGRLVFIHRPERLPDIFTALKEYELEPRELMPVLPHAGDVPSLIVMTAMKGGRPGGFTMRTPLVVRDACGQYSAQMDSIYGHPDALTPEQMMAGLKPAGSPPDFPKLESVISRLDTGVTL